MALKKLSASTNGKGIAITGTDASNANPIHTATTSTTDFDTIYLEANNSSTVTQTITILYGGVANSDSIVVDVPSKTTLSVIRNLILNNGQEVKAFASSTNTINVFGKARDNS